MASVYFRSPSPPPDLYHPAFSQDESAKRIASIGAEEIEAIGRALVRIALSSSESELRAKVLPQAISQIRDAFARPGNFIEKGLFIRCGARSIHLSLRTIETLEKNELYFSVADESRYLSYSLKSLVESGGT